MFPVLQPADRPRRVMSVHHRHLYIHKYELIIARLRSINDLHTCPSPNRLSDINIDYIYIRLNTEGNEETLELSREAAKNSP